MFANIGSKPVEKKVVIETGPVYTDMEQRRNAWLYFEHIKRGFRPEELLSEDEFKNNKYICPSPSSESDNSEFDDLFVCKDEDKADDNLSFYDMFLGDDYAKGYITDWDEVKTEKKKMETWEDIVDNVSSHQNASFMSDFCNQTGMCAPVLSGIPHKDYYNDALEELTNRVITVTDKGEEVSFSGCDINYDYISCSIHDDIKDGHDYGIIEVYKEPQANICYPIYCSNGRSFLVKFYDGRSKVIEAKGIQVGHYYEESGSYYHHNEHVIFINGHAINVMHCGKLQMLKGAIIDCGVTKYRYSMERVIDAKVEDNNIKIRDDELIGITDAQNGQYEYKVTSEGIRAVSPFKVKYHHFNIASMNEYEGLRTQCNHIKNVMRMIPNHRNPCVRRTLKHSKLLALIKDNYDKKAAKLDVFKLRRDIHRHQGFYDARCLHTFLLMMGFTYNHGAYVGKYIKKLKKSCAKVKWASSACTCYARKK